MTQVDKWSQFIAQLIEKSQDNRIQWSTYKSKAEGTTHQIEVVYQTKFQGKALRLYEAKVKQGVASAIWWGSVPRDEVVLKIVDEQQATLFTFPKSPALYDLLNAVQYQVNKIDEFLKGVLEQ